MKINSLSPFFSKVTRNFFCFYKILKNSLTFPKRSTHTPSLASIAHYVFHFLFDFHVFFPPQSYHREISLDPLSLCSFFSSHLPSIHSLFLLVSLTVAFVQSLVLSFVSPKPYNFYTWHTPNMAGRQYLITRTLIFSHFFHRNTVCLITVIVI